jgi:L-threonine-O-3-phosphate decarboxylase
VKSLDFPFRRVLKRGTHPQPRNEVLDVPSAVHGSLNYGELQALGLRPEEVLDFSANVNPYAPSPAVRKVLVEVSLDRYPDRECLELRTALAESLGVAPERILPGNGASELIWLAALAFVGSGSRVLILGPTFGEYARTARLMGARVSSWQAREETGFAIEPAEIADCLEVLRPEVVFLCNPNNPTGATLPADVIAAWARQYGGTLFVLDEAYLPFASGLGSAVAVMADNVLVLRSMTKDFGLAGLRLGFAVGDERVIALLRRVQPPWSVNAPAQAAGVAALSTFTHRQRSLEQLTQAKHELTVGLAQLGLIPVPSATHFFLVKMGDGAAFRQALLQRGLLVRDCASFGLPAHVRIAARRPKENARLLAVIREVIHAG